MNNKVDVDNWYVVVSDQSREHLRGFLNLPHAHWSEGAHYGKRHGVPDGHKADDKRWPASMEITMEQFKTFILKQKQEDVVIDGYLIF